MYPECLIKYICQSEDSKEIFVGITPSNMSPSYNANFTCPDMVLLPYFIIREDL